MISNIIFAIIGASIQLISMYLLPRIFNVNSKQSIYIGFLIVFIVFYYGHEEISTLIGESDEKITLTEMVKPVNLYEDLEVFNLGFDKIYKRVKITSYGPYIPKSENVDYVIEYTCDIKNNGEEIIAIDDPNGTSPINFNESLIFRDIDGVEGKEEYVNFGDVESSDIYSYITNEKIIFSTRNPINPNTQFKCVGKIILPSDFFENFSKNRKYKSDLYIRFGGTTREKYKEPNGYGFIIKEKNYSKNLSDFINRNLNDIETIKIKENLQAK